MKKIRRLGDLPGLTSKWLPVGSELRNQSRSSKSEFWVSLFGRRVRGIRCL